MYKKKDNSKLNNINNFLNNNHPNQNNNFSNTNYESNLNNTLNYLSGNTVTPNIFGQNFTSNNNNSDAQGNNFQNQISNQNNNNNNITSKLNDISILNNYNTLNHEKEKLDNSFRDLTSINKNRVNSRLESLKEQYEIFSINKLSKDELEVSTSMIKEKTNKKSNNLSTNHPNNFSNLNTNISNNIINPSKINNSNKISLIIPASNRDCGVFESNFVLKTDKRSFLLNENALIKRTTSEDK